MASTEDRVSILLNLLDDQLADALLLELPEDRRQRLQERLAELEDTPPTSTELDEVLGDLERHMRQAFAEFEAQQAEAAKQQKEQEHKKEAAGSRNSDHHSGKPGDKRGTKHQEGADGEFEPSDNPMEDLNRIDVVRLAAALRAESAVVISLMVNCLSSDRAGEVLQRFPGSLRDDVFLRLKEKPNATRRMLEQLAKATIDKALSFDELELAAENVDYERKIVQILRSMERKPRNELLQSLEEKDSETVARLREMMYSVSDIAALHDRTVQKLLADLDTNTLTKVLKQASEAIKERILNNLSRRAREALQEELELTGSVSEEERVVAEKKIVEVLIQLDQRGELAMMDG
jgi:flagellar motor switch protein FliG